MALTRRSAKVRDTSRPSASRQVVHAGRVNVRILNHGVSDAWIIARSPASGVRRSW
ncbi:hypothetical protein [Streptomyces sp. SAS_260]|uniref:hypothetical protein n=1 Tax=Streptomyces sp. SAS_260 TaxID=3412751 RepID=UPI00403D1F6B